MIKKCLYILLITLTVSCQKQEISQNPLTYNYSYFPLDSGAWRQYNVTFIEIDDTSNYYDTITYQLLETATGWYLDAANDSMMRIERLYRDSSHHSWKPLGVWQAGVKGCDAFQIEENIKYLKIKFPAKIDKNWNGNAYNRFDTLVEYRYTITSIDEPFTLNNFAFDSVLTVTQIFKETIIDKVNFHEKYAKGVGLIEKQQISIYSGDPDADIPIEERISKGTQFYQTLTGYGKN